jgi:alpha-beta hydrolase superfamily lysophospholipase
MTNSQAMTISLASQLIQRMEMTTLASDSGLTPKPLTVVKRFAGVGAEPSAPLEIEAEAALRQFSQERLMAYGVAYADAKELRSRVAQGEAWLAVAQDLARICLIPPEAAAAPSSPRTTANRFYRASALFRMSQMMFLTDNDERRSVLAESVRLYSAASDISADREPVSIQTDGGMLAGWLHCATSTPVVGTAIVIGGVEGWAMDFGALGTALARRGVAALMLDGPGQGQSRLAHRHFLTLNWANAYRQAIDYLDTRFKGLPIGFVGNSMGGTVATLVAALDHRIRACVNNGGSMYPTRAQANPSFFKKMITHCGAVSHEQAVEIWGTISPLSSARSVACPYLIVQGGKDPLVAMEEAEQVLDWAGTGDKTMVVFSDGIHCIYNHEDDKQDLIADWMSSRLAGC